MTPLETTGDAAQRTAAPGAAMSIDVEDWFQVENLKRVIPRDSWKTRQLRVEANTDRLLELLDDADARCTFFVLGWIAERCPSLVQRIAGAGHELGCHGYGHELVYELSPEDFRDDVHRCKALLEDLSGSPIEGYRAPSFSITDWSVPILRELGFSYDSSVFPAVAHDRYGRLAGIDTRSQLVELAPGFHEICISCLMLGSRGVPWGGGGYFRVIPYPLFRRGVQHMLRAGEPYVFYIHPWEIDPGQPRVDGLSAMERIRHYAGLSRTEGRYASLLAEFEWTTLSDVLASSLAAPAS